MYFQKISILSKSHKIHVPFTLRKSFDDVFSRTKSANKEETNKRFGIQERRIPIQELGERSSQDDRCAVVLW